MITDTWILASGIEPTMLAAVSCPPWCAEPTGHGMTDSEIFRVRELNRLHFGAERTVVASPKFGEPVTARLFQFTSIEVCNSDVVVVDPVTIEVGPTPECGLTLKEIQELSLNLLRMAEEVRPADQSAGGAA